jgi:hypothetical protein
MTDRNACSAIGPEMRTTAIAAGGRPDESAKIVSRAGGMENVQSHYRLRVKPSLSKLHVTRIASMKRRSTRRRNAQARAKPVQRRSASRSAKTKSAPASSRDKVRAYRKRMRARGMRLVTIWVPDVRSPEFVAEARRQCLLANSSPHAAQDQAWVDSMSDWSSN